MPPPPGARRAEAGGVSARTRKRQARAAGGRTTHQWAPWRWARPGKVAAARGVEGAGGAGGGRMWGEQNARRGGAGCGRPGCKRSPQRPAGGLLTSIVLDSVCLLRERRACLACGPAGGCQCQWIQKFLAGSGRRPAASRQWLGQWGCRLKADESTDDKLVCNFAPRTCCGLQHWLSGASQFSIKKKRRNKD